MSRPSLGLLALFTLLIIALMIYFRIETPTPKQDKTNGPTLVSTVLSRQQDIPIHLQTQATVTPMQSVTLRPQVNATLLQVHVREGQQVVAGQALFSLDTRQDAAKLAQAQALAAASQAQLQEAERDLKRSLSLLAQGFVAQSAVDAAQTRYDSAKASLASQQASTHAAQVGLGYFKISAPFGGRIGAIDVHPGALVQAAMAGGLVTLTQMDPIAVSFSLPERELGRLLSAQAKAPLTASVTLESGQTLAGRLSFIDNAVDSASGNIKLKAEFANPDKLLWPGAFVKLDLQLGKEAGAVLLPASSIQTGPDGQFVYLLGPDQSAQAQPIQLKRIITEQGQQFAVVQGLAAGARVISEGGQQLRPGSKVKVN